jgi:hypothetical protein
MAVVLTADGLRTCPGCNQDRSPSEFRTKSNKCYAKCARCRSQGTGQRTRLREGDASKICRGCGQLKDLRFFYTRADGRIRSRCYECELAEKSAKRGEGKEIQRAARQAEADMVKETGMKTCSECRESLPISRFAKNGSSLDGHDRKCSVCVSMSRKKIETADEDRYRKWASRDAMFREISEARARTKAEKGVYAWSEDED